MEGTHRGEKDESEAREPTRWNVENTVTEDVKMSPKCCHRQREGLTLESLYMVVIDTE